MAIAACRSSRRADGLAIALLCVALGGGFMAVRELDGVEYIIVKQSDILAIVE